MNLDNKILSEITIFNKYAKYLPFLNRRETWGEICDRYQNMMLEKYPLLEKDIISNMQYIRDKKVLPSMRAMQFAGRAIEKNNSRLYNCAFLPIDSLDSFSETMFLLLGGTGVGYSVQFHHVDKLPEIQKATKDKKFLVGDSLEGWADAIKVLFKAYFGVTKYKPRFDFSDIRPKGHRLVTAGGKAPGPGPLKECIVKIENILEGKQNGDKLTPIECHDIQCHIANSVLSGGIRRSAMIALFSFDDLEMLESKYGNWWEMNEQRGRANNSAVIVRSKITKSEFDDVWKKIELSNAGEPGLYFTNDKDWGTNPCCEIALRPYQFCNLCEVNVSDIVDQEDLNNRVHVASFFGTLQAGFTDFHYLRAIWRTTTEKEALIGVGMTGIASNVVTKLDLGEASIVVKNTNAVVSNMIGIKEAARTTTIKPSGTTSCVLGTSSGIHAWHNNYYVRRMRIMKNDPLYTYLSIYHSELVEDDKMRSHDTAVISIPQMAPEGSILRTESALELLERVKKFNVEWVKAGHRKGANTNNVSATISIDKSKGLPLLDSNDLSKEIGWLDEWQLVGEWMWDNKDTFNGLSVLPYDGGSYVQAPFTDCTETEYKELFKHLSDIDLTKVVELDDNTEHSQEAACAGGTCDIK
jgi:ribonucleoside-triphosphate reductase (thioredoxin)